MSHPFRPTARDTNWLLAIGFCSVGYAMYLRYLVIENHLVGQSCDTGLTTWLCLSRVVAMALHEHQVFGWVALGAALLNFIRPTLVLFAIGLAAASLGVVLHNAGLAGLAAALLVMSLARPAIETV
jgi:hypothetical protein